ncbi:MAG: hypothetical protein ACOY5B_01430 [Spirochaetota bacterium]
MGLRERASDYSKETRENRGVDLGLELRPGSAPLPANKAAPETSEPVKAEAPARSALPSIAEFPETTGHKSRLDSILNLVEIYKEFGSVRSAADLWQVVAYSLMAQLGTKNIAIFMEDDGRMHLMHALGFTLASDYSFSVKNRLCRELGETRRIVFTDDILGSLPENEAKLLSSSGARYAAPVFRYEELRGVILINPPAGRAKFSDDDLFYLKICGELLGAMEAQLRLVAGAELKSENLQRAQKYREYARDFSAALGQLDNHEPLKDALENEMLQHFPESPLLLMLREDFFLRAYFTTGYPRDSVQNLEVPLAHPLVEKIKQGQRTFTATDFDSSESFTFLGRYRQVWAHPVLHRREFLGIAFIADQDAERVDALGTIVTQYVLQNHVSKLRDHATSSLAHADNPVMAIRNFIAACEEQLDRAQEPFAVIVTDIANYNRLHNLHGDSLATGVRDFTRRTLREIMESQDFSTEVFHGHFVSVLRQKEAGDAWRLSRILQKQAGKFFPDEDLRPVFQHRIYARPHIQAIPFELLFKAV